jgi:hypothetical protein
VTVMAPPAFIDVSIEVTCLAVEPRSAKNPSRRVVHKTDQKKNDDRLKHRRKSSKMYRERVDARIYIWVCISRF